MKLVLLGTTGYHANDRRQTACFMLPELGVVFDAGTGLYRVAVDPRPGEDHDPLGVLKVTREGFSQAAEAIAQLALPTVIVQEGGYLCPALPLNLIAFLRQFDR